MIQTENSPDKKSEVISSILNISKRLAKENQGAFFVIADRKQIEGHYRLHYPQIQFAGNLLSKGMEAVVEKLATLDGAMIFTPKGEMVSYGARILKSETPPRLGPAHARPRRLTS